MNTQKIDFREVLVLDLMDRPIMIPTNYARDLGNSMYVGADSIETADVGKKVFYAAKNSTDLLLEKEELEILIRMFELFPVLGKPLHDGIREYLKEKMVKFNGINDGNNK